MLNPLGKRLKLLLGGWLVWGDADLSTPPPGGAKKWCQWHPLRESDVAADLIRQQVPDVHPEPLIIHVNKRKRRVWNEGMKTRKLKTMAAISYIVCYLSLVTRASTPSRPNLLFPWFYFLDFPVLVFYLLAPRLQSVLVSFVCFFFYPPFPPPPPKPGNLSHKILFNLKKTKWQTTPP